MFTPLPNPRIDFRVIYQDKDFLIVDKPPKMPIHPLQPSERDTLANGLVSKFQDLKGVGENPREAGLVHRLDNNTSGIVIVARNNDSWKELRDYFAKEEIQKEYLALVVGCVERGGKVISWIAHHPKSSKKMICIEDREEAEKFNARDAWTFYAIKERFKRYTLLRVRIGVGRRHQIRVHLASIGHPLAGDDLYQNDQDRKRDTLRLNRHFLHASRVAFLHPVTKEMVSFESPLPDDLQRILKKLEV